MNPTQSYPFENFDRLQSYALLIADEERAKGRELPRYGYSNADWEAARERLRSEWARRPWF
jgi:hypothetical protein